MGGLGKFGLILGIATLVGGLAAPLMAADYHGQGGRVFYHGMQGPGFRSRIADGGGIRFQGGIRPAIGRSRFEHRGFGNDGFDHGMTARNDWRDPRGNAFARRGERDRFHANHLHVLASRDFSMRRGSGISVINSRQPDYDFVSNYAGSVDVYHANGGTYISGYGDGGNGGDGAQTGQTMRPRAKIIDVTRMHNSCAYENGVCVIRP